MCDRGKRPCKKVTVMGSGFLNSTNMTCHVKEFTVTLLTIFTWLLQCFIRCCYCFFMACLLIRVLYNVAACGGIDFDSHHDTFHRFTLISFR